MYQDFFGLEKCPFSMTPDPALLLMTPKHREAFAGLLFAITARKGLVVVTGDAGTGKTTLISKVMRSAPSLRAEFSFVLNPVLTPSEFLEYVLIDFGIKDVPASKTQRLVLLQQLLLRVDREKRTCVLIVDEAHKLTPELLEEIRLLSNFETSEQKLLQIVLAGQTELADLLNRQDLRQVKQRIAVRLATDALSEAEVRDYIRTRWTRCGGKPDLPFSDEAVLLISRGSKGIPRVVNAICDNALTNAFGAGATGIDVKQIMEVIHELQIDAGVPAPPAELQSQPATPSIAAEPAHTQPIEDPAAASSPVLAEFSTWKRYMPPPDKGTGVSRWAAKLGFGVATRG